MLTRYHIDKSVDLGNLISNFKNDWRDNKKKVFFFKTLQDVGDVRNFYFNLLKDCGVFFKLAEDARINDREKQRTQKIWMEVRFDPAIKNAYRHSANAQPLHTDGSYIHNYPNSTLMCCEKNTAEKGETIFIDAEKVAEILKNIDLDLFEKIYDHELIHERSGDKKVSPILVKNNQNVWNVNWNYYCISENLNEEDREIKERFQKFLLVNKDIRENLIELKMNKGDALIWKDQEVLHGRNSFLTKESSSRFIWKCAVNF